MLPDDLEAEQVDPWRFAAVLLYARGATAFSYAGRRRTEATIRSDVNEVAFWISIRDALLVLLPKSACEQTFH